ncbi:hypothetical protein WJX81_008014 [Elliptochloris bilobata]|uniref:Glutaredoxin n=1 Tax=Elliptochloris bilobata TaxID=381761 RepID=A0AAW1S8E0_9CHLO
MATEVAESTAANTASEPAQVAVVTTVGCAYCKRAKDVLRQAGISFEEIELSRDLDLLKSIQEATGLRTVPQIFLGGVLVGGATELQQLVDSKELQPLLARSAGAGALPADLRAAVDRSNVTAQSRQVEAPHGGASAADYARLQELAGALPKSEHRLGGASYRASFTPAEALGGAADKQALLLRLVADAPRPRLGQPLNAHFAWAGAVRPAPQVAEDLRQRILALYDRHLAPDGRAVDYAALGADPAFAAFCTAAAELQVVDMAGLSREERMAFYINVYNQLIVHALVLFGPAEGTLKRLRWFDSVKYRIGGLDYSANDVEHGVLRGNAASPASPFVLLGLPKFAGRTFGKGDPRMSQAVTPMDPRIHFALVCGAKSCPPIKVYTAAALEEGLEAAAASFCESEVEVREGDKELVMSKVFSWYGGDFGSKKQLLIFLLRHLPEPASRALEAVLEDCLGDVNSIRFTFKPYDWSQNTM